MYNITEDANNLERCRPLSNAERKGMWAARYYSTNQDTTALDALNERVEARHVSAETPL